MKLLIEIGGGTRYSPKGAVYAMSNNEMEQIVLDLNYLTESSQRELSAYRNIGTVANLKRIKQQEIRRRRRLNRAMVALRVFCFVASCAFLIWCFASFIDVISHNLDSDPVYQVWNLFTLLF